MNITSPTLDALRTQFTMGFDKAFTEAPVWWSKFATEIPSSTRSNTYGWLAKLLKLREWVGPRIAQNLSEHSFVLVNKPYEGTVEVDRDDIDDNNLGMYTTLVIPQLGYAAAKHPDELMVSDFFQSATALGYDGLPIFDDAHPTFDKADTTYDNDFGLELSPDNFNTVWSAMASYTGEDGRPLGVMPNKLIVAPQKRKVANEIVKGSNLVQLVRNVAGTEIVAAATVDNQMQGWAEVEVLPELAGNPTAWYLADCSKPIKPAILQMRRKPQFVTRDSPTDPKVFDQKTFTYGVDGRWRVGPTLPFLIARSKP